MSTQLDSLSATHVAAGSAAFANGAEQCDLKVPPLAASNLHLGCPECDLLLRMPSIAVGETARCPRCRCLLTSSIGGFSRVLAYALSALILLLIAVSSPFLGISLAGQTNTISLATALISLSKEAGTIALLLAAFVVLIPAGIMLATTLLTILLLQRRPNGWLVPLARNLFRLRVWYMADVFAVGVIVSLVKLTTMADIALGTAFWAYLGFALCFLMSLSSLDRLATWAAIDSIEEAA